MSDRKTLDVYAAKAEEYQALVGSDAPDADLQRFIDALPAGARVLDIGCGPGMAAGFMAAAGHAAEAWDPVAEMRALAAARPGVTTRVAGYDDLTARAAYDGIWANFSMLHTPLARWETQFAAVHDALVPAGLFHFGTKLGTGEVRDSIGRMYSYMEETPLRDLFARSGFAIEFARTGEEAGLSGEVAPFIVILARKAADV
ncbi:MAG: class I SAM-dependent methyltransferase [Pseudomonadota bacterium]